MKAVLALCLGWREIRLCAAMMMFVVAVFGVGCRLNLGDEGNGGGDGVPIGDPGDGDVELPSEATESFFRAFQIDPVEEDTAGPKFIAVGDVNQDGLLDVVSAWNQSQPVQLHLQQRDAEGKISFRTVTIAGTSPVAVMAGLALGQINDDGWLDIVVLVKANGGAGWCPTAPPTQISNLDGEIIVYFNPGSAALVPDGDQWAQMRLVNPYVRDRWIHNQFPGNEWVSFEELKTQPENAGFTSLAVGDLNNDGFDDIVVALNPGECKELGQEPPTNTVDVWVNPGAGLAEIFQAWGVQADLPFSGGVPISVMFDAPRVTSIALSDIDGDGDLDIVAAYHDSLSLNVRWARNPFSSGGNDAMILGGSDGGADRCVGGPNDLFPCPDGAADCVGVDDGICQNGQCVGGANPGADCQDSGGCAGEEDGVCTGFSWRYLTASWELRPIGQVDTHANVIAMGDIDGDGFDDVVVRSTLGRAVQWFRRPPGPPVIEPEFPPNNGPTPNRFNFPWPVFTITEFLEQAPEAIAVGDITGNGQAELLVAVEGGVYWFDATVGASVFAPWFGYTIIQDEPDDSGADVNQTGGLQGGTGAGVSGTDAETFINALLVVDLDGDGKNDVIGTLDRRSGSGLSDDRLVWYRNIRAND